VINIGFIRNRELANTVWEVIHLVSGYHSFQDELNSPGAATDCAD